MWPWPGLEPNERSLHDADLNRQYGEQVRTIRYWAFLEVFANLGRWEATLAGPTAFWKHVEVVRGPRCP
jgi:hypothetical protein